MLGGRQQAGASTSGGDGLAGEVAAEARWLFGRAAAAGAAGAEGRSGAPGLLGTLGAALLLLGDAAAAYVVCVALLWVYFRARDLHASRRAGAALGRLGLLKRSVKRKHVLKVDLIGAKGLLAKSIGSGVPDPFAVLKLAMGSTEKQTQCASVVAATTDPRWGETFRFEVTHFPAKVIVSLHDWTLFGACENLGRIEIIFKEEDRLNIDNVVTTGTSLIGVPQGRIMFSKCVSSQPLLRADADGPAVGPKAAFEASLQKRWLAQRAADDRLRPGAEGDAPAEEKFVEDFSCAFVLAGSLHSGRLYLWDQHFTFSSTVLESMFGKDLHLSVRYADVESVRPSAHAVINPALSIVLSQDFDAAPYGIPLVPGKSGDKKVKFASFWNRGRTQKILEGLVQKATDHGADAEEDPPRGGFLKGAREHREVIGQAVFPMGTREFFERFWSDDSTFVHEFNRHAGSEDCFVGLWKWDPDHGMERQVNYKATFVGNPLSPKTRVVEDQHYQLLQDVQGLVIETSTTIADTPLAGDVTIEAEWEIVRMDSDVCKATVSMGTHFGDTVMLPGKITAGALAEGKKNVNAWIELALQSLT